MPHEHPAPDFDDFVRVDWQDAVDEADEADSLLQVSRAFNEAAERASEEGRDSAASVFKEMGNLCSLCLRPDRARRDPFVPLMEGEGFRTAEVDDLSESTIAACANLAEEAPSPEMRARMADVAWVAERNYESAQTAYRAYLDYVRTSDLSDGWAAVRNEFERAFQVVIELGNPEHREEVQAFAEGLVEEHAPTEEGYLCAMLLDLVKDYGLMSEARLDFQAIAEEIAQRAFERSDYNAARRYWNIAMDLAASEADTGPERREARRPFARQIADAFEAEAEQVLAGAGGHMVAAESLQKAIEALRRVGGEDERIEALHGRLVEV